MKARYIGESFGVDSLINGKIYTILGEDHDMYRVIDDSGEDYLYSKENPAPLDGSSKGGRWEIIEEWWEKTFKEILEEQRRSEGIIQEITHTDED